MLRRRTIAATDLPAVLDLLAAGFPARSRAAWAKGLDRLACRPVPEGLPRFGWMLEADGRAVGVLLAICAVVDGKRRCNLSSWHALPAYAPHAALLLGAALALPGVTLTNISPAAHTEPIIEAQGFQAFCRGSLLVLPGLAGLGDRRRAALPPAGAILPERDLLDAHRELGCSCLVVREGGDLLPFVFSRAHRLRGALPASRLLFCRDLDGFARSAGPLGRALLRGGIVGVLVDTDRTLATLRGRRINAAQGRYWRGPDPPRFGDLAFTETAIFED